MQSDIIKAGAVELKPDEVDILREMFEGDPLIVAWPKRLTAHLVAQDDLSNQQPWPTTVLWPTLLRLLADKLVFSLPSLASNGRVIYRITQAGRLVVLYNDFDSQGNKTQE